MSCTRSACDICDDVLHRPCTLIFLANLALCSAGTLCDADGELFIKPCTQNEINFYQSARRRHPDFAAIMPTFIGTLLLSDQGDVSYEEMLPGLISETGIIKTEKNDIVAEIAQGVATAELGAEGSETWIPSNGKMIKTDMAVVLENASCGFQHPNILDVKLGRRLWADDAPAEKKRRFDKITSETTHSTRGFRIAGMRVYRGSEDASELDDEEYKIYDKDYGRYTVNDANVNEEFRKFVFNKMAGINEELGQAVCSAFVRDLQRVEDILERHESRMYSSSLLFTMEGDGRALRAAIEMNNEMVSSVKEAKEEESARTTRRVDSGIALDDDDDDLDELSDFSSLPMIYSLKLIDFAHAEWTPGQGPDENVLSGVRSLREIFAKMAE